MVASSSKLADAVASAIPSPSDYNIHHVSHPATKSDALYSPPLNTPPASTTLTSHFLGVSSRETSILLYAIEVLIYQTPTITTLFVSKADSTGFFTAKKTQGVSPVRAVTTAFLQYLLDETQRDDRISHVSLFARAQDQYLFPNSVKISTKHILSDRQLIKWWARVLDPIVKSYPDGAGVKGFLLVPGLDRYESKSLFPPVSPRWILGHPYDEKGKPVRECIPHFPDDPKSRFMMELEVDRGVGWKGVTSLSTFWELMAFRQECSLGKSVGFLNLIIPPKYDKTVTLDDVSESPDSQSTVSSKQNNSQPTVLPSTSSSTSSSPKKSKSAYRLAQSMSTYTAASILKHPTKFKLTSQAQLKRQKSGLFAREKDILTNSTANGTVNPKKHYDRLMEALTNSDFGSRKLAQESSKQWIEVAGSEQLPEYGSSNTTISAVQAPAINVIVARKRDIDESQKLNNITNLDVNVLQPSIVRKKSKMDLTDLAQNDLVESVVNVLPVGKKDHKSEPASDPSSSVVEKTVDAPSSQTGAAILIGRKKHKPTE